MTDVATRAEEGETPEVDPSIDETSAAGAPDAGETAPPGDGTAEYAWAPQEPQRRRKRLGLWIGIPAAAALIGLVASSLVLIAPGTAVAGVGVGGMTPGGAADAISERLADTTLAIEGPEGSVEVTGADLGATVDAEGVAEAAFAAHPMWNPTSWFSATLDAPVTLDDTVAAEALRAVAPGYYVDPVDAAVTFDADTATYVVTDAVDGQGIDVDTVREALQAAFVSGEGAATLEVGIVPVAATATTDDAVTLAASLNGMLDVVGFYVGEERTVPIDRAVAASWLTVAVDDDGELAVTADEAAIQGVIDTLPAAVNREAVNATVITNSSGAVLDEQVAGATGRSLDATDGLAEDVVALLGETQGMFPLSVTETDFTTTALARTIEVDLAAQRTILYENGQVVGSFVISSGAAGTATPTGRFTVNGFTRLTDMGCFPGAPYCVEDVPYATWFAPNIGFHGASSLRSSLGYPQSHGCVNAWDADARFIYEWSRMGTEVWVHS